MIDLFLENSDNIPTLIQGVGFAFVSIFLSTILLIYSVNKGELLGWDRVVILEKVVNANQWLFYLALLFLPPFLWGIHTCVNIAIIILAAFGIVRLLFQLKNMKKWIYDTESEGTSNIGYRQELREEFLREEKDIPRKIRIWSSTWSKEDIYFTERRWMKIFFEQCASLSRKKKWKSIIELLSDFNINKDKRKLGDWENIERIENLLEIAESVHGDVESQLAHEEGQNKRDPSPLQVEMLVSGLLNFFISHSLGSGFAYMSLFKTLERHLSEKEYKYKESIFRMIHNTLFEKIPESKNRYDIWLHFPHEWQITESKIKNKDSTAQILFKQFEAWMTHRFSSQDDKEGWDSTLDAVSRNLFPEISPDWWAEIVTYIIRPCFREDRIIELFNSPPNFGFWGHMVGPTKIRNEEDSKNFDEEMGRRIIKQEKNAIKMVVRCFGKDISTQMIEEDIRQLEGLETKKPKWEQRKKRLLKIFNALLTELKSRAKEQSK